MRFHVAYDQELRILQSDASTEGLRSMVKVAERSDRSAWKGIFPEVRSTCEKPAQFLGAVTDTTTDASSTVEVVIVIDEIEEAACDPCVLGTWSLDLDTFKQQILASVASEGGLPPGVDFDISGAYYVAFDDELIVREQRDGLVIAASLGGTAGFTTRIDSFGSGTYSADGELLTLSDIVESHNQVQVSLPIDGTYRFPGAISEGVGTYTCDADRLVVTVEDYPPVTFARVDKILTPPDAPPESDD